MKGHDLTERTACPMTGDEPMHPFIRCDPNPNPYFLIPCGRRPASTTDAQAEHERAMGRFHSWSRDDDGTVILWGEM